MIETVTFSKPTHLVPAVLGKPYVRIKIRATDRADAYYVEYRTETQSFHEHMGAAEVEPFIATHAGTTFRNCVVRTDTQEITMMANRHGTITKRVRALTAPAVRFGNNRPKNYILAEGVPVPFLVALGVMTANGNVRAARYAKFRQINRFLEFIDDIVPALVRARGEATRPIHIVDFGCGKSYLTFAVHHYFTVVKQLPVVITGLDVREDVITLCSSLSDKLHCEGLSFAVGTIETYHHEYPPDLVLTLHACDTATDYALEFAVKNNCTAILSVPCCQHELNSQLSHLMEPAPEFTVLLKHGLLRERFAALATDALRAEYLEAAGYAVQVLEFIDMEHTPKNILIRAVRTERAVQPHLTVSHAAAALTGVLGVRHTLQTLLDRGEESC
ncbi:MAG: SAM-dependent methyltransferase [Treponema sp.]|nr:SAM-dependent methyltransferase [Treponema sp.]